MAKKEPTGYYDPQTGAFIPVKKKKKVWPWIVAAVVIVGAISAGAGNKTEPAEAEKAAPETEAAEIKTEAETQEADAAITPEEETEEADEKPASLWTAIFGEPKEKEPEVIPERGTPEWYDWYIKEYKNVIVVCAKQTLDKHIANYEMSLAPQKWNLSVFDEDDNVYASTSVTWQDRVYQYIFIGQLKFDEDGEATGSSGHFLALGDEILYNDHYADDFLELVGFVEEQP